MRIISKVTAAMMAIVFLSGCDFKEEIEEALGREEVSDVDVTVGFKEQAVNEFLNCGTTIVDDDNIIDLNREVVIRVRAQGGTPNYRIARTGIQFAAETAISRIYDTPGVKTEYIEIRDKSGLTAECPFTLTVRDDGNPTTLACTINESPVSPHVNDNVVLTMNATGGAGSYTFYDLNAGGSSIASPITDSGAQATAPAKYATTGNKNVVVLLKDAANDIVSCSKSFTVRPALSATITANTSSQVTGEPIQLTGSASGFAANDTLTYTYSVNSASVALVPSGSNATLNSNSAVSNFVVTLTVTGTSGESTTTTKTLSFIAGAPLNCSVTHSSGIFSVNDPLTYTVTSTTGEAVQIVTFDAGADGSVLSSTSNTRNVKYSTSGVKSVSLTAKSTTRNTFCNLGAQLTDSVTIRGALACSAYTNFNPSYAFEDFQVFAIPASNSGVGAVRIKTINYPTAAWLTYYNFPGPLSAVFNFGNPGSWRIDIIVEDDAGHEATCSTMHAVWW